MKLYGRMSLIRHYEDHLYRLFLQGLVPGTLHQCQGQEAVAVGVCAALRVDDVIFSTHRPVGHLLAKGASIEAITAEIWGKANGFAGGKGGQMHLVDVCGRRHALQCDRRRQHPDRRRQPRSASGSADSTASP